MAKAVRMETSRLMSHFQVSRLIFIRKTLPLTPLSREGSIYFHVTERVPQGEVDGKKG